MLKQAFILFFMIAAVLAETAYFAFQTENPKDKPFIVEFTQDRLIQHARDLLSGVTTDEPHIRGRVKKLTANYNLGYSYHIDPNTINFFNEDIDVCDASFIYTEDYLDQVCGAFLPGCVFCPWSSKIVEEVKILKS